MEAVQNFEFHIDLDNCEKLYDYARFEYIHRPAGGWDLGMLAAARKEDPVYEDETTYDMLKRMDKALMQKGMFEKEVDDKKEAKQGKRLIFDSFSAFGNDKPILPKRILPVFKPGDIVKGYVYLNLKENMEAENVKIKFKGFATTNYRIHHKHGYYDDIGEDEYVKEQQICWKKEGSEDSSEVALTSVNIPTGSKLAAGAHNYPFEFRIPVDARQSTPQLVNQCFGANFAFISYYLKATINKGKSFKRGNILSHMGIWVERVYDIASNPVQLEPFYEEEVQSTGIFNKGNVTCRVHMPARAYTRTDNIQLKLEVNNNSGGNIDAVKVRVLLTGRYRSKPNSWHGSHSFKVKGNVVKEGLIAPGENPQYSLTVPLEFRDDGVDGNLIPAGTLNNCDLIDVEYSLCVNLKRKGLHKDVDISIPISVGTHNSREEPLYPKLG